MTAPLLQKPGPSLSRFMKHKVGLDVSAGVRDQDGKHTPSYVVVDYLDCEHCMNQSWDASGLR